MSAQQRADAGKSVGVIQRRRNKDKLIYSDFPPRFWNQIEGTGKVHRGELRDDDFRGPGRARTADPPSGRRDSIVDRIRRLQVRLFKD